MGLKRCQNCETYISNGPLCDTCIDESLNNMKKRLNSELRPIWAPEPELDKGTKHDSGKVDLTLNPIEALEAMALAFTHGQKKYGRNNYKKGLEVNRTLAAALRHIHAFAAGESLDPESGESHLSHALAALAMTVYTLKHHPKLDDRDSK